MSENEESTMEFIRKEIRELDISERVKKVLILSVDYAETGEKLKEEMNALSPKEVEEFKRGMIIVALQGL